MHRDSSARPLENYCVIWILSFVYFILWGWDGAWARGSSQVVICPEKIEAGAHLAYPELTPLTTPLLR